MLRADRLAIGEEPNGWTMLVAVQSWSTFRRLLSGAIAAAVAFAIQIPARGLVVETLGPSTTAPADDPGWNNFTSAGRSYIYLGDGWALSARHVGPSPGQISNPSFSETLQFSTGVSAGYIPDQAYLVPNPCYGTSGCITPNSEYTDLQLVRLDTDPLLPSLTIASSPIMAATPIEDRHVTFITRGRNRNSSLTYWNATQVAGNNNDSWAPGTVDNHNQSGYTTTSATSKRWGTNQIADETVLANEIDPDLRFNVWYDLSVGRTDVVSMATIFDAPNPGVVPESEAQAVSTDSGGAVFHKRNDTTWELIGIINGVRPPQVPGTNPAQYYDRFPAGVPGIYGMQTFFADLSYYHDVILDIMEEHAEYSVAGDINLDGEATGYGSGNWENDDVTAFVAGWGYDNETGVGTITSWKNGDLDRDGNTDADDYTVLADALPLPGDYNDDDVVDALDYTVWRNAFDTTTALPNDETPGGVTSDDYSVWKQHFGWRIPTLEELIGPSGAGGVAGNPIPVSGGSGVPEPTGVLLLLGGASFLALWRRR